MTEKNKKIIAMWSGPRNISTAMMRSWENRPDTVVWDEPFYGWYLAQTGKNHPMKAEIIDQHGSDINQLVAKASNINFQGKTGNDTALDIFYQKHMTHHILPEMDTTWMKSLTHCFLIRHPEEVVHSYTQRMDEMELEDIGFQRQWELFEEIAAETGTSPVVIHSVDILNKPQKAMPALCQALDVPFYESMLSWPQGRRDSDGVWEKHWYDNVRKSTGFAPYQKKSFTLPAQYQSVADEARPFFEKMQRHALNI